jgi:hypothetical protein
MACMGREVTPGFDLSGTVCNIALYANEETNILRGSAP